MEKLKLIFPCILFGLLFACLTEACKLSQKAHAARASISPTASIATNYATPRIIILHDTTKPKKVMTDAERREYLSQIYQFNYDKYFAPEFKKLEERNDKLSTIVTLQARSIQELSTMYADMRQRAIHSRDSMQQMINGLAKSQNDYQRLTSISEQKRIEEAIKQTENIKKVINWLWAIIWIIVMSVIIVCLCVKLVFKKTNAVLQLVERLN